MPQNNNALPVMSLALLLGAALDFGLAAMFAFTKIVDLGDEFVTQVVVGALVFAGLSTLAIRPFLLRRIKTQQEGKRRPQQQKLID